MYSVGTYCILSSLIFSVVAMVLSLARILRSHKEGKRKRHLIFFRMLQISPE